MPSLMDLLRESSDDEPERPKLAADIEAIRLRDSYAAFNEQHVFKPGMIVRQKPQVRLYKAFGDNDRAIVVEMLPEPVIAGLDRGGTSHYREPLDMLIGCMSNDDFAIYHVDSRRFEPVPEEN